MTDGAARTLESLGERRRCVERALPRLTSRDPARVWTSGPVDDRAHRRLGRRALARPSRGSDGRAAGGSTARSGSPRRPRSQMALTLARPEGNGPGGRGLALFYRRDARRAGPPNGIRVNRLKDKLGTRKVPTAELDARRHAGARRSSARSDGVRDIAPMLNVTRTWNAVCARRRHAPRARARARLRAPPRRVRRAARREAAAPRHARGLEAEYEAAFHLAFRAVELLGRDEAGELDEPEQRAAAPAHADREARRPASRRSPARSEALEAFGGAGYVEDTGLPRSCATRRCCRSGRARPTCSRSTRCARSRAPARSRRSPPRSARAPARRATAVARASRRACARAAAEHAERWWAAAPAQRRGGDEAGARRFALTLGRALELALLVEHAQWDLDRDGDGRSAAAARRFARAGVDLPARRQRETRPRRRAWPSTSPASADAWASPSRFCVSARWATRWRATWRARATRSWSGIARASARSASRRSTAVARPTRRRRPPRGARVRVQLQRQRRRPARGRCWGPRAPSPGSRRAPCSSTTPACRPALARELAETAPRARVRGARRAGLGRREGRRDGDAHGDGGRRAKRRSSARSRCSPATRSRRCASGRPAPGSSRSMVNQICIAGLLEALAEGLRFAERVGLDVPRALEAIAQGAAQSWQLDNRAQTMLERALRFRLRGRLDAQGSPQRARRGGAQRRGAARWRSWCCASTTSLHARGAGRLDTSSLITRLR